MDALIKCLLDMKENKSTRETEWCVIRVGTRGVKSKVTPLRNTKIIKMVLTFVMDEGIVTFKINSQGIFLKRVVLLDKYF